MSTKRALKPEFIELHGHEIEVQRRPFKRNYGISLRVNGRISVSVPLSTPLARIREFVGANRDWLVSQIRKYEILRRRFPRRQFRAGETFPLLGRTLTLVYRCGREDRVTVEARGHALIVRLPPEDWVGFNPVAPHPEVFKPVAEFYERQGRARLEERVAFYSRLMRLQPSALSFRAQKSRWGSCNSQGHITLNWRIVVAPLDVVDYVVVHELAHLRFYDHSVRFWTLVAQVRADFEKSREWLREHQYGADFLSERSELHDL